MQKKKRQVKPEGDPPICDEGEQGQKRIHSLPRGSPQVTGGLQQKAISILSWLSILTQ